MNDITSLFFELIRVAIGNMECLSHSPSAEEWGALYAMAKKQTLVGVCFAGVQKALSDSPLKGENLPAALHLQWMGMTARIQQLSEKHRVVISKVIEALEKKRIEAIFMKGLVCAQRYPQPELRQCGDIDFVVREEDFGRTLDAIDEIAEVDRSLVHEHHGMAHMEGVQLEPHYKIHNFQNPLNDRMMRRLQREVMDAPASFVEIGGRKKRKFPMEFEGMFLVSHMVNHVYEEGLGLRQILDFSMWLNHINNEENLFLTTNSTNQTNRLYGFDMELYHEYLRKMRMTRAARIFTCICVKYLGVDRFTMGYAYTEEEETFADTLLADIMRVGNFAHDVKLEAGLQAYMWTTKRAFRLGYLCPSEARWWPVSKLTRFFWKKMK